jgi:hypothetical protein
MHIQHEWLGRIAFETSLSSIGRLGSLVCGIEAVRVQRVLAKLGVSLEIERGKRRKTSFEIHDLCLRRIAAASRAKSVSKGQGIAFQ